MPVATSSAAAQAVAAKYADIAEKHNSHREEVEDLRQLALRDVVPAVLAEVGMEGDADAEKHVRQFLKDKGLLFRFFRRSRYSSTGALDMLSATLTWRLRTDLDSLSLSSLHPLYTSPTNRPPLFWANSQCCDRFGRPLGVISLQSMERVTHDDGHAGLDECREYIVGSMESVRRFLAVQYAQIVTARKSKTSTDEFTATTDAPPLQMVILFSLKASGMANLELELLPFLLDLLKNHFPGMVGAVYIQHFGWVHSGMWALAKRILPEQALARIFFPSNKDLAEHFDLGKLPVSLGGDLELEVVDETNDVMRKYARPHWNARLSRSGSRSDVSKAGEADFAEGDDEDDEVEDVEASSAPPSPRGQSGTSTPLPHLGRSLSRAGSFESLMDEFHSLSNSPQLSRTTTPRPSRPTTPHAELSSFHFTRAHPHDASSSALRLTPSAVHKLHNVQMTRGSSLGGRSRTMSDAVVSTNASPAVSRGASPERSRRRRAPTVETGATTTAAGRGGRTVHFGAASSGVEGLGIDVSATTRSTQAARRVGSLRDFRLLRDDLANANDGIDGGTDSGASSTNGSDERASDDGGDSDASGKTGERTDGAMKTKKLATKANKQQQQQTASRASRFFSLWRSPIPSVKNVNASTPSAAAAATAKDVQKGDTVEDGRDGHQTSQLANVDSVTGDAADPTASLGASSPDSPQLQVPDIEEPPLSEMTRLFSRRSHMPGHVSPYNSANPFYGYPAYPTSANAPGGIDPRRRYHVRRRKRDLVRTLMYLFVLRLLALHRHVRAVLLAVYRGAVHAIAVGGLTHDEDVAAQTIQFQRYQRLRSAGSRFSGPAAITGPVGSPRVSQRTPRRESQESAVMQSHQRPKPQPLVALGFRKRYAVLMIVIAFTLLRREWRSRRRA